MTFQIFDAVCVKGRNLCKLPFRKRLAIGKDCVNASEDVRESGSQEDMAEEADCIVMMQYDPVIRLKPKHMVERKFANQLWHSAVPTPASFNN